MKPKIIFITALFFAASLIAGASAPVYLARPNPLNAETKPFRAIDMAKAHDAPAGISFPDYKNFYANENNFSKNETSYAVYYQSKRIAEFETFERAAAFASPLTNAYITKRGVLWINGKEAGTPAEQSGISIGSFSVFQNKRWLNRFDSLEEAAAYAKIWKNGVIAGETIIKHNFTPTPEHKLHTLTEYEAFASLPEAIAYARASAKKNKRLAVIAVGAPEYDKYKILWENSEPDGSAMIEDVPYVSQLPELPRGCEITALAMLFHFKGLMLDKNALATEIKKAPLRHDNPNNGFIGDMYSLTTHGLGVYHEPIAELARGYMPREIIDVTGCEFEDLFYYLDRNRPVWIITNSRFAIMPDSEFAVWQTPDGPMKVSNRMHAVLVVGYDERYVYYNDPNVGAYQKQPRKSFIEGWIQMGRQAVTIVN